MEKPASHDDANLILRLFELRREERMRKARNWFMNAFRGVSTVEQFQQLCPFGSDESASFRMVVTYWDMAASFVTTGVLNRDLFYRSAGELLFVYERIADIMPELRAQRHNPAMWADLETAAKEMIDWGRAKAPDAYEVFKKMVRGA